MLPPPFTVFPQEEPNARPGQQDTCLFPQLTKPDTGSTIAVVSPGRMRLRTYGIEQERAIPIGSSRATVRNWILSPCPRENHDPTLSRLDLPAVIHMGTNPFIA